MNGFRFPESRRSRATARRSASCTRPTGRCGFRDDGDPRHGTPDDPRLVLIGVDIHAAVFLEVNKPQPVVLFEIVKGWLTGTEPELGKMHTLKP